MLSRLKTNYQVCAFWSYFCTLLLTVQLVELVKSDNYVECIQEVSDFTVQALQQWHWSPNRCQVK